jgi:acetyltransferase-like isoleucine patch superfamily enzyme
LKRKIKKLLRRILFSNHRHTTNRKLPLPEFGSRGHTIHIELPYRISNPGNIYMGDNIGFGPGTVMEAQTNYPRGWMRHPEGKHVEQTFQSCIRIGNGVTATGSLQIVAFKEIEIGDDVMFATNVFICDGLHNYDRGDTPYKYQGINNISPIYIRKGCWIGQNVVILPGVEIGEYSIVGANSVVNQSIPPMSIAVGSPAKVIKIWNKNTEKWESKTESG